MSTDSEDEEHEECEEVMTYAEGEECKESAEIEKLKILVEEATISAREAWEKKKSREKKLQEKETVYRIYQNLK